MKITNYKFYYDENDNLCLTITDDQNTVKYTGNFIPKDILDSIYDLVKDGFEFGSFTGDYVAIYGKEKRIVFYNLPALRKSALGPITKIIYKKAADEKIIDYIDADYLKNKKIQSLAKGFLLTGALVACFIGSYLAYIIKPDIFNNLFHGKDSSSSNDDSIISFLPEESAYGKLLDPIVDETQNITESIIDSEKELQDAVASAMPTEDPQIKIFDEYIAEYATYFNLDPSKTIEFAHQVTNDYTKDFAEVIGNTNYVLENPEAASMMFCYQLQRDRLATRLSEYGLSKNDFIIPADIVTLNEDKTLNNGLTYSQYLGKICDLLGSDKYYSLAISYLETGRVTSNLALHKNNFGGLRSSGDFFTFPTPEAGIIAFCYNLKAYEKFNLQSIYELSGKYVHGNINNPSETWVNNVLSFHNQFVERSDEFFLPSEDITNTQDATRSRTKN